MQRRALALALAVATWPLAVAAQERPPLRIVVPSVAGSAPDLMARLLGDELRTRLDRSVVIDNRPGAGGIVATMATKTAPPDGHTVMLAQAAVVTVTPLTYRAAKYDMASDFETVAVVADTPMLFVSNAATGAKTLAEAIAAVKARPDSLVIGSPSRGSIPHLAAELLALGAKAEFRTVPMSHSGQAVQAIVNGDSHLSVDGIAALLPHVRSGRLRALAVTAQRPLPGLDGIPLAKDTVPGLVVSGWFMLFAPKGTPSPVLTQLNRAVNDVLAAPDVQARLQAMATYPVGGSLADARAFLARERTLAADAVRRAGLQPE